jgi:hypothetical protein
VRPPSPAAIPSEGRPTRPGRATDAATGAPGRRGPLRGGAAARRAGSGGDGGGLRHAAVRRRVRPWRAGPRQVPPRHRHAPGHGRARLRRRLRVLAEAPQGS